MADEANSPDLVPNWLDGLQDARKRTPAEFAVAHVHHPKLLACLVQRYFPLRVVRVEQKRPNVPPERMKRRLADLFRQAVANGNPLLSGGLVGVVVVSVRLDEVVVIPIAVEDHRAPFGNFAEAGEVEIIASQKVGGPF